MIHDSTWLGSTRAIRWTRLAAPVGLLLACVLLAGLPAAASAITPDVRGEWALTVTSPAGTLHGKALITSEANAKEEFAAKTVNWESQPSWTGSFTGTLEGAKTIVKTTSAEFGPVPPGEFNSSAMTVEATASTLSITGSGELTLGTESKIPATETLTRVRTQHEIEEQEARERREQEEREARANVRGEWSLTLESGATVLKGIARITSEASAQNEFASSSALFEGSVPGTFSGKLEGGKATVTITTEAAGPAPAGHFTSSTIVVTSGVGSMSMTGAGVFTFPPAAAEFTSTLTATRVKTYAQLLLQEKAEREAKEKQEAEAREAAEKSARELKEKELKERQAREAAERAAAIQKAQITPITSILSPTLVSVLLSAKALTASSSGAISLALTNPNSAPVHGSLKLTLAKTGKASGTTKHTVSKSGTLGEASFSLSGKGTTVVKLKLSHSGRAQLAHSKTLHVLVTLTTNATGQMGAISKTYSLTLRAHSSAHHGKG